MMCIAALSTCAAGLGSLLNRFELRNMISQLFFGILTLSILLVLCNANRTYKGSYISLAIVPVGRAGSFCLGFFEGGLRVGPSGWPPGVVHVAITSDCWIVGQLWVTVGCVWDGAFRGF